MKTYISPAAALAVLLLSSPGTAQVPLQKTSGVYLTAADYKNGRLSFEGDCGSKAHRLELHDVLHKTYIHVTHETEKRRFAKSDLFGFRACDGNDYRFASNLEHQILETRELYIYAREVYVSHGRGRHTVRGYFFSAGAEGPVLTLTLENLRKAFPANQKFHDALDAAFGAKQKLSEYDGSQKMFKVNRLLTASRE
jgi:hypothetical protein